MSVASFAQLSAFPRQSTPPPFFSDTATKRFSPIFYTTLELAAPKEQPDKAFGPPRQGRDPSSFLFPSEISLVSDQCTGVEVCE